MARLEHGSGRRAVFVFAEGPQTTRDAANAPPRASREARRGSLRVVEGVAGGSAIQLPNWQTEVRKGGTTDATLTPSAANWGRFTVRSVQTTSRPSVRIASIECATVSHSEH